MANLVLVRHGTSEYNAKGLWAGWHNPDLTEDGKKDAIVAGETLKNIHFDYAYSSPFIRHKKTLDIILQTLNQNLPIIEANELKERNYGDFNGKNKWEIKKQLGDAEFLKLRRSWDYPVPNGETLKQVYERVVPYYEQNILPELKTEKNVIVSSSGNALRSLVKYLENISDEDIATVEIAPGEVYIYTIDENGKITNKEIRNHRPLTV
ncbi:MAG TPA: 2,3-bisphosphoglycerate-dependent phosphoglycerate mutase [Methylomirabilota bacterium]|nr:2,3-bisphosphoglycerate-dependent phosphoglycerate mutase [Methylomirabilota bacterium]